MLVTYVIVQNCCNDASCVEACPAECIHPTPDEPDFLTAEMLYINPEECVDCGACLDVCPVGAIHADYELPAHLGDYQAVNEEYFTWVGPPSPSDGTSGRPAKPEGQTEPLRVAVVGAGPSGWYVTEELVNSDRAEIHVTVLDRLPVSHGLVRYGVAPDHQGTKDVGETFDRLARHKRVSLRLGVEVGNDVTHDELLETHHAVVYCTGAAAGRELGIPNENLPGVTTSADFVHWYNAHPGYAHREFDLATGRAVIIGNGNVALDIVRVLTAELAMLATTDIADHALDTLRASEISEVVVLARRGPAHAAFTSPELRALVNRDDLDVVVEGDLPEEPRVDGTPKGFATAIKLRLLAEAVARPQGSGNKRVVLRFGVTPVKVVGDGKAHALTVRPTDGSGPEESIEAGLVITATGYRSEGVPGIPFDAEGGRFAHDAGRVIDPGTGSPLERTYSAGWAKRGASGVIGTNRLCAAETVRSFLDDVAAGDIGGTTGGQGSFDELLAARGVDAIDADGWAATAAQEIADGKAVGRPRVKRVRAASSGLTA